MYVHAVWLCCGHEASASTHIHNINMSYSSQSHTYISNIGKLKTDQEDHKHNREAKQKDMEDGKLVKMYASVVMYGHTV